MIFNSAFQIKAFLSNIITVIIKYKQITDAFVINTRQRIEMIYNLIVLTTEVKIYKSHTF